MRHMLARSVRVLDETSPHLSMLNVPLFHRTLWKLFLFPLPSFPRIPCFCVAPRSNFHFICAIQRDAFNGKKEMTLETFVPWNYRRNESGRIRRSRHFWTRKYQFAVGNHFPVAPRNNRIDFSIDGNAFVGAVGNLWNVQQIAECSSKMGTKWIAINKLTKDCQLNRANNKNVCAAKKIGSILEDYWSFVCPGSC